MRGVPIRQAVQSIRDGYLQLPGLSLTCEQVQQLHALDSLTCEAVLAALVDAQFLALTLGGHYVRRAALARRGPRAPSAQPSGTVPSGRVAGRRAADRS
jgi:hypothetical protein